MSLKALFYYVFFVISLFVGAYSFFYLMIDTVLKFIASAGGLVTATAIFLLLIRNLPSFQKNISPILSSINWVKRAELASIAYNIQGNINQFRETVNNESADLIPEAKVEWVTDVTKESFFDDFKGKVIVRMSPSKDNDANLARASLLQVSKGVIPEARMYIDPKMNVSIDLSLVKKILVEQGKKNAYRYFVNEITNPKLADKEIMDYLTKMEVIDDVGLFTRLFLRELKEFSVIKGLGFRNIAEVRNEVKEFFKYIEIVAQRKIGELIPLEYDGEYIKTAIIYVAKHWKMDKEGITPYIRRALINREKGHEIIFFIAFDHAIDFTRKILDLLTKNYGMTLIKNSDQDYVIDGQRLMCATVIIDTNYVIKPQDNVLLEELLVAAVTEAANEEGWANLDAVEKTALEMAPKFKVTDHGYSSLIEILKMTGLFDVEINQKDDKSNVVMVRCKED